MGEWRAGLPDGQGELSWGGGAAAPGLAGVNRYRGGWRAGQRAGVGSFEYADGSRFRGEWERNVKHGEGVYVHAGLPSSILGSGVSVPTGPSPRARAPFGRRYGRGRGRGGRFRLRLCARRGGSRVLRAQTGAWKRACGLTTGRSARQAVPAQAGPPARADATRDGRRRACSSRAAQQTCGYTCTTSCRTRTRLRLPPLPPPLVLSGHAASLTPY